MILVFRLTDLSITIIVWKDGSLSELLDALLQEESDDVVVALTFGVHMYQGTFSEVTRSWASLDRG